MFRQEHRSAFGLPARPEGIWPPAISKRPTGTRRRRWPPSLVDQQRSGSGNRTAHGTVAGRPRVISRSAGRHAGLSRPLDGGGTADGGGRARGPGGKAR